MSVQLLHGDCLDLLRTLPDASVDAVVTDPPYTAAGGSTNGRSSEADTQFFAYWLRDVFAAIQRVVKPTGCGFIFCDWRTVAIVADAWRPRGDRQTARTWSVSQALVWDREAIGLGAPFRNSYEMIAFARGPAWVSALPHNLPTVIRHRYPYGRHKNHGAEKPIDLCTQLVSWALPTGGTILDPFMGSGTTGVAALSLGYNFVGIEQEADYFAIAQARLAAAQESTPEAA